jgi:hypothetical protein
MNAPQQYHTDYCSQQGTQLHQGYPQSDATNYYQPLNMPNHPPPAYDALSNPDEDFPEQAEPISSEQVHDAEAFVDEETLGWIPSQKDHQQMRRLEVRSPYPYQTSV